MDKSLPDKWIRKAIYDAVTAELETPIFDFRAWEMPKQYILMSTQTNEVDKNNKCEYFWESSILLEIYSKFGSAGNTGSRLQADIILEDLLGIVKDLQLDFVSGLEIINLSFSFPSDIVTPTTNEMVYRKFIRIECLIK